MRFDDIIGEVRTICCGVVFGAVGNTGTGTVRCNGVGALSTFRLRLFSADCAMVRVRCEWIGVWARISL
jgi:hypothetical protein